MVDDRRVAVLVAWAVLAVCAARHGWHPRARRWKAQCSQRVPRRNRTSGAPANSKKTRDERTITALVFWRDEYENWVADIPDLLDCSAFRPPLRRSLQEAIEAKQAWLESARRWGPVSEPHYRPSIYSVHWPPAPLRRGCRSFQAHIPRDCATLPGNVRFDDVLGARVETSRMDSDGRPRPDRHRRAS